MIIEEVDELGDIGENAEEEVVVISSDEEDEELEEEEYTIDFQITRYTLLYVLWSLYISLRWP